MSLNRISYLSEGKQGARASMSKSTEQLGDKLTAYLAIYIGSRLAGTSRPFMSHLLTPLGSFCARVGLARYLRLNLDSSYAHAASQCIGRIKSPIKNGHRTAIDNSRSQF